LGTAGFLLIGIEAKRLALGWWMIGEESIGIETTKLNVLYWNWNANGLRMPNVTFLLEQPKHGPFPFSFML
jgi:hypothetical protein